MQVMRRFLTAATMPIWTVPAVLILAGLAALLAGCGGEPEQAPALAALPTRTPTPATPTPAASAVPAFRVEVVSMWAAVDAFLTEAETISALDRIDLFRERVVVPMSACLTSSLWPGTDALQLLASYGLNLTTVDMAAWRAATDAFPEEELIALVNDTLGRAADVLPPDYALRVCLFPVPAPPRSEEAPEGGALVQVFGGDLVVVACGGGAACLNDTLRVNLLQNTGMAYQVAATGVSGADLTLLGWTLLFGRSDDFVRRFYPDTALPWSGALTPEQEAEVWSRMQDQLGVTYQDYPGYRRIDRFLFGTADAERYPPWGGVYIGSQIVQAYRAAHPELLWAEIAALPPDTLLAESGYAPGS